MYEFIIGIIVGFVSTRIISRKSIKHAEAQAGEQSPWPISTHPIKIPNKFTSGELKNFWG